MYVDVCSTNSLQNTDSKCSVKYIWLCCFPIFRCSFFMLYVYDNAVYFTIYISYFCWDKKVLHHSVCYTNTTHLFTFSILETWWFQRKIKYIISSSTAYLVLLQWTFLVANIVFPSVSPCNESFVVWSKKDGGDESSSGMCYLTI